MRELTVADVQRLEARLYTASFTEITPDEVAALINDWRKKKRAFQTLTEYFRIDDSGRRYYANAIRSDTFECIKKSAGM